MTKSLKLDTKILFFREGNQKTILSLIPGTNEQVQAELAALKVLDSQCKKNYLAMEVYLKKCYQIMKF